MSQTVTAPPENCDECGFVWDLYSDEQAVGALLLGGAFLRGVLEGVDVQLADTRPDPTTWSILEYVDHIRAALWNWRFVTDAARQRLELDLTGSTRPDTAGEHRRFGDVEETIAAAEAEAAALFELLHGLSDEEWAIVSTVPPGRVDQRWIVRHVLHEILHHTHDTGRVRARLGDGPPAQTGSVAQINRSDGGVPKTPVEQARVTAAGLEGDRQDDRVHHGRPFQALCLYGTDVIDALVAEGHPIAAGSAGENLTIAGVDWATIRPGTILAVGDDLTVEISSYATPCAKNAQWFADRDFRRMLHEKHPGWSRVYATVLRPGSVRTGDPVVVEP